MILSVRRFQFTIVAKYDVAKTKHTAVLQYCIVTQTCLKKTKVKLSLVYAVESCGEWKERSTYS
jgi:hypothetical protein